MKLDRIAQLALAAVIALPAGRAGAEEIKIASLDWPPYSGADLPDGGTSIALIRHAFEAAGHGFAAEFLPWERAVRAGTSEAGFVGYGPEYYDPALDAEAGGERCLFSKPYGTGPLGLVENRTKPVEWTRLEDLAPYVVGTVDGYLNTPEFDALAAAGTIKVEAAADDATNVRKVARGRIEAAVIDANVLAYLLETDPKLAEEKDKVEMDATLLAEKTLHLCFRNDAAGRAAREVFDAELEALGSKS